MDQMLKKCSVKIQLNGDKYKFDQKSNVTGNLITEIFDAVGLKLDNSEDTNSQKSILKKLWVVIYSIGDFLTGQPLQKEDHLRYAQGLLLTESATDNHSKDKEILPIIHLVPTDIFMDNMYGGYKNGKPVRLPKQLPRIYQIIDSSIWNYMVPLIDHTITYEDNATKEITFKDKLKEALNSISNNYDKGLYYLEVANEYADLNARMVGESYLRGAHASGVSPFIFHSESVIKELIQKEFKKISVKTNKGKDEIGNETRKEEKKKRRNACSLLNSLMKKVLQKTAADGERVFVECDKDEEENDDKLKKSVMFPKIQQIAQHNWRILLVDDKAVMPLSLSKQFGDREDVKQHIEDAGSDLPRNCKLRIIKDVLCEVFSDQPIRITHRKYKGDAMYPQTSKDRNDKKQTLLIEYAQTRKEAEEALKDKKYDIILLDYFLDESGYGYELLETVYNDYNNSKQEYKYGPHGLMFFMFISAYSSAVYERLLAEGFNRSEDCWYIAVGACPTNTPNLFAYNLLQLMYKQLNDSGISRLTATGIYNIMNKIYNNSSTESVRQAANNNYQEVLNIYFLFKKMLKDVDISASGNVLDTQESTLITDFVINNVNMSGLLEHLIQLVHLTAFGTIRQWSEMWEEYIYIRAQFDFVLFKKELNTLSEKEQNGNDTLSAEKLFNELCRNIESYILKLKSL